MMVVSDERYGHKVEMVVYDRGATVCAECKRLVYHVENGDLDSREWRHWE